MLIFWATHFLVLLTGKIGFSWRILKYISVPVNSTGLEATAVPCPGYMGSNRNTQETHCPVVPQVLSSLDSPPSFHIKGNPYACSLSYVQGSLIRVKEEGHLVLARNKSSLIVSFLYCKGQHKCKKVPSRLNSGIYIDKNIGETLSYFR